MKMFLRKYELSREGGFTVIELVVSLLIVSIISLGATMANVQLLTQTSRNDSFVTAEKQALNAVHWITTDMKMAQVIEPGGTSGFPLTIRWVEWDNIIHQVTYELSDSQIIRTHLQKDAGASEWETPQTIIVASYIDPDEDMTSCSVQDNVLILRITSKLNRSGQTVTVTKETEITSRPNL